MIRKGIVFGIIFLIFGTVFTSGISVNIKKQIDFKISNNMESSNGLISHWKFNEGSGSITYDSEGDNDCLINGSNWTMDTPSGSGYALDFDGINDYIIRNPVSNFPSTKITLAFWMNTSDTTLDGCPISYASSSTDNDFAIGDYKNFDILVGNDIILNTGVSANDGIWHHIAITWKSSSGQIKIYKDSIVEFSNTLFTGGSITPNGSIVFGCDQDCIGGCWESHQFYKGILDEIRIYDRVLNDSEIQYLYNNPGCIDFVYVDDDFDENTSGWQIDHFDIIQDGINAVCEDGTVYVYNGTYYENVFISKKIILVGEDKNSTIINGSGSGDVVHVTKDFVNITGFTIKNSGYLDWNDSGIEISSNHTTIMDNTISNNRHGIFLYDSNDITITGNTIILNIDYGLVLEDSSFNTISGNNISTNEYAGLYGIGYSTNNSLTENIITKSEQGINLYAGCVNNTITDNIISNNKYGIGLKWPCNNSIYHNNFIDNTGNAYDEGNNCWDNGYPSGGNYWDDYNGTDIDEDGIGDTPYPIPVGSNQDNYPLIYPWGENPPVANYTYLINGRTVTFNASSSYDRDGEIVEYVWMFEAYCQPGKEITKKFCEKGLHNVTLYVEDDDGYYDMITKTINITADNPPPNTPQIYGPNSGRPNVNYTYQFVSQDPENENLYYEIHWGDGTTTDWIGPYTSNEVITVNHSWSSQGKYIITARARDICKAMSDWAELEVTMSRDKSINIFNQLLHNFLQNHPNLFPILRQNLF